MLGATSDARDRWCPGPFPPDAPGPTGPVLCAGSLDDELVLSTGHVSAGVTPRGILLRPTQGHACYFHCLWCEGTRFCGLTTRGRATAVPAALAPAADALLSYSNTGAVAWDTAPATTIFESVMDTLEEGAQRAIVAGAPLVFC
jgi:hypothetical protein